jgi:hypothetical protein
LKFLSFSNLYKDITWLLWNSDADEVALNSAFEFGGMEANLYLDSGFETVGAMMYE